MTYRAGNGRKPFIPFQRWERRVGLSVAIPIVTFALFLLTLVHLPPREDKKPIPMKILIEVKPPEPKPDPVQPDVQQPDPEKPEPDTPRPEVPATRQDSTEKGTELVDPVKGEPDPAQPTVEEKLVSPQPAASLRDWIPNADESAELRTLRDVAKEQSESLEERADKLRDYIVRQQVESAAKEFKINSDGGLAGAIRTLDIEGFPDDVVKRVFNRYGIVFERRFTKPVGGRQYLNAAVTDQGTFRNVNKEGYYDVMVLSAHAMHVMASREVDALQDRGYDPRTTRIRVITFGIIINEAGDYDFGVIDLEVEKIR